MSGPELGCTSGHRSRTVGGVDDTPLDEITGFFADILKRTKVVSAPVRTISGADFDQQAVDDLERLIDQVAYHPRFEHHRKADVRSKLAAAVAGYQQGLDTRARRAIADAAIQDLTANPLRASVYFGIRDLTLPREVDIGIGVITPADRRPELLLELAKAPRISAAALYCQVDAIGGTEPQLIARARPKALLALALLRQQLRTDLIGVSHDQLRFDLDGTVICQLVDGRWYFRSRVSDDLSLDLPDEPEMMARLAAFGRTIITLAPEIRARVETALQWLEVAARAPDWKVGVPAIFAAMESLLVPERNVKDKDAVLLVRATTLQVIVEGQFSDPSRVLTGYGLRSDLAHGTPVTFRDVSAVTFLGWAERWAFQILTDFIKYATENLDARRPTSLTRALDASDSVNDVCVWLKTVGGDDIVRAYAGAPRA